MPELLDPPQFIERMRGSSVGRHPWFLSSGIGGPPDLPPETIITDPPGDDGPPDDDQCPACRYAKVGLCKCGYDWDNWRWVDRDVSSQRVDLARAEGTRPPLPSVTIWP